MADTCENDKEYVLKEFVKAASDHRLPMETKIFAMALQHSEFKKFEAVKELLEGKPWEKGSPLRELFDGKGKVKCEYRSGTGLLELTGVKTEAPDATKLTPLLYRFKPFLRQVWKEHRELWSCLVETALAFALYDVLKKVKEANDDTYAVGRFIDEVCELKVGELRWILVALRKGMKDMPGIQCLDWKKPDLYLKLIVSDGGPKVFWTPPARAPVAPPMAGASTPTASAPAEVVPAPSQSSVPLPTKAEEEEMAWGDWNDWVVKDTFVHVDIPKESSGSRRRCKSAGR